ncbi:MAG: LVIVD repeat-containing protein [Crocinitomicaceae bacterium]
MKNLKKYIVGGFAMLAFLSCEKEEITPATDQNETKNLTSNSIGQGGSLAQFTIIDSYLYSIDSKSIHVFDLSNSNQPELVNSVDLGFGIETIHANSGNLFIGTTTGVRIIDASDPVNIVEVSEFRHVTSCDPVVANTDYAFSTLRGGTDCGGWTNQLDIISIQNINNPTLSHSFPLTNPWGLGIDMLAPEILYVCDGTDGLKVFDISNSNNIELIKHYSGILAKDVISTKQGTLIVLGLDAVFQYNSEDPLNLTLNSEIVI